MPEKPEWDETLTTEPLSAAFKCGAAARVS
jgi:hypothetical protein